MPDAPLVHDISTPRRSIGRRRRKWVTSTQTPTHECKCASCVMCKRQFPHGEPRLQQLGNRDSQRADYVHATCVYGGGGHYQSQLIQRDASSQPTQTRVARCCFCSATSAWQSVLPVLMDAVGPPDAHILFASTHDFVSLSRQMNSSTLLHKPPRLATPIQRQLHKQLIEQHSATSVEKAILISQSGQHTGANFRQPTSEACEAEDRLFRVSVARRLMLPHPASPLPAGIACDLPKEKINKLGVKRLTIADTLVALTADMQLLPDALSISFRHTVGPRSSLNGSFMASRRW